MTTPLTAKLTHVRDGLARLLSKEKNSRVLRGILQSYLNRVQELEATAWLVISSRTLDGEGAQLDAIGRLLVCPRAGLIDSDYKIALRARIRMLRSSGTPVDLEDVTTLSLPTGFDYTYDEAYPKTSLITVLGAVDFTVGVLWRNLLRTKAGGTKLYLIYDDVDTDHEWLFADGDVEVTDADHSDGDAEDADDPTGLTDFGGYLSDVFSS
jgi:hypothetical protein